MFEADCLAGLRKVLLSGKTLTNVSGSSWSDGLCAFVFLFTQWCSCQDEWEDMCLVVAAPSKHVLYKSRGMLDVDACVGSWLSFETLALCSGRLPRCVGSKNWMARGADFPPFCLHHHFIFLHLLLFLRLKKDAESQHRMPNGCWQPLVALGLVKQIKKECKPPSLPLQWLEERKYISYDPVPVCLWYEPTLCSWSLKRRALPCANVMVHATCVHITSA